MAATETMGEVEVFALLLEARTYKAVLDTFMETRGTCPKGHEIVDLSGDEPKLRLNAYGHDARGATRLRCSGCYRQDVIARRKTQQGKNGHTQPAGEDGDTEGGDNHPEASSEFSG